VSYIYKVSHVPMAESGFEKPAGVEELGSYNYMPKPFREAEWDEFYHHVNNYLPKFIEFRQVKDLPDLGFSSVYIYWQQMQGWAIRYPNKWHSRREDEGPGYSLIWDEPVRYYKIGCDHVFDRAPGERGLERWTCQTCGGSKLVAVD
jgi:hypothetical protein